MILKIFLYVPLHASQTRIFGNILNHTFRTDENYRITGNQRYLAIVSLDIEKQ